MPVRVEKRGDKYRIVEAQTGRVVVTSAGNARDGGGHTSKSEAEAQARAMNAAHRRKMADG